MRASRNAGDTWTGSQQVTKVLRVSSKCLAYYYSVCVKQRKISSYPSDDEPILSADASISAVNRL